MKMNSGRIIAAAALIAAGARMAGAAPTYVTNVTAHQRFGTNVVDITYALRNPSGGTFFVEITASTNAGATFNVTPSACSGAVGLNVTTGENKQVVWHVPGDLPGVSLFTGQVKVVAESGPRYMIIDISGGPVATNYPVSYKTFAPPLDDEHKTSKIVLLRIPAGTFVMGSLAGELGRSSDETQHTVTFTNTCYVGVYEITQAQYTNVMGGSNPALFIGNTRPVEWVSWDTVRGGTWPGGAPDSASFMGKLRAKTGLNFDLPTEARWEYACRAGSTSAWNNGTQITNTISDGNLNLLGRYANNGGASSNHAPVGSYLPNAWGLYDMHGNVWEWCLDWYATYGGDATDPAGPGIGSTRVVRGGSWYDNANLCRSAGRNSSSPENGSSDIGVRVFLPAGP